MLDWLASLADFGTFRAVGHRVARQAHHAPERIAPVLLTELRQFRAFGPFYLPGELAPIEALQKQLKR